jgi:hypothetical protein
MARHAAARSGSSADPMRGRHSGHPLLQLMRRGTRLKSPLRGSSLTVGMPSYDFRALSPYDFEGLVRDLLQQELEVTLETFAVGRDGGTDLRYSREHRKTLIVQCKHFVNSGFRKLIAHLKKEAPKVLRLQPSRYLIATSVSLTPGNKLDIARQFLPFRVVEADIFGADDLNNLLGKFPEIEKQTFKLWLTSSAVLEKLLHNDIYIRTQGLVETLARRAQLYVQNSSFRHAWNMLQKKNVCIITGIPGVGKTMLAEMLLVAFVDHGYEPILMSSDVGEGDKVFKVDSKQIFYYDDFLGQASLTDKQLNKNEDARLLAFIKRVLTTANKRFVLTTREYILADARLRYERISNMQSLVDTCVLAMSDYTEFDRGKILYNHLYFSDLSSTAKRSVIDDEKYIQIIRHPNYNPRLIEKVIELSQREEEHPNRFLSFMMNTLAEPSSLWRHAYEHLGDSAKLILLALVSLSSEVVITDLQLAFSFLYRQWYRNEPPLDEFMRALQVLQDTFIQTNKYKELLVVSFHNPSVRDFMLWTLDNRDDHVGMLIASAYFFDQLSALWKYSDERKAPLDPAHRYPRLSNSVQSRRLELLEELRRTLRTPCTTLTTYETRDKRKQKQRDSMFIEQRLLLIQYVRGVVITTPMPWFDDEINTLAKAWANGRGSKRYAVQLIDAEVTTNEMNSTVRSWFLEDLEYPADFEAVAELRDIRPELFSEEDMGLVRDAFGEFASRTMDFIERDADSSSEMETAYGEAKELASALNVEWEYSDEWLQEQMRERESKASVRDYYDDDLSGRYGYAPRNETAEMRSMFESLVEDE